MFTKFFRLLTLFLVFCPVQALAQDDELFKIEKSEVEAPLVDGDIETAIDDTNITPKSSALLNLLDSVPSEPQTTIVSYVPNSTLTSKATSFSKRSQEGWADLIPHILISKWQQSIVGATIAPSWLERHFAGGNKRNLKAKPFIDNLEGELNHRGFDDQNYFVIDEIRDDIIFARYYFKVAMEDGRYFEPSHAFDPSDRIVTMWKKIEINREANQLLDRKTTQRIAQRRAREVKENQQRADSEVTASTQQNTWPDESQTTFRPPIVQFGSTPRTIGVICGTCGGHGKIYTYKTENQCRRVDDSDMVFVRSKLVCEKKENLTDIRKCHVCNGTGQVH